MNRAVKEIYDELCTLQFGVTVLYGVEKWPQIHQKIKENCEQKDVLTDPAPLVKYVLRKNWKFRKDGEAYRLPMLKEPKDPYGKVCFKRFTGKFIYNQQEDSFSPQFDEIEGSRWLEEAYNKIEDKRISKRWAQLQEFLSSEEELEWDLEEAG